jgi:hypothetical protein
MPCMFIYGVSDAGKSIPRGPKIKQALMRQPGRLYRQIYMCEALLIAGDCGLPSASSPRKMAHTVTTQEVR